MTKIEINLDDKLQAKEIYVIHEEKEQGVKKELEKTYRSHLNRRYSPLKIPISCEYCAHVGEAMWHCHNPESRKNHLNVMPNNVCSKWKPNQGLLMFLHRKYLANLRK